MSTILLAEDDKNFGAILKNELEEESYAVDLVHNGVEAVLCFIAKPYDFVLMDIRMPRLNGNDALRIIKRINPGVPVITFSGNAGRSEMAEAVDVGAIKCLVKPFEISNLRDDLRNYMGKKVV